MKTKTAVDEALTRLSRAIERPWDNGSLPSYEDTPSPVSRFVTRWTKPTAFSGTLPVDGDQACPPAFPTVDPDSHRPAGRSAPESLRALTSASCLTDRRGSALSPSTDLVSSAGDGSRRTPVPDAVPAPPGVSSPACGRDRARAFVSKIFRDPPTADACDATSSARPRRGVRDFDPLDSSGDYLYIADPHNPDPTTGDPTHTIDGDRRQPAPDAPSRPRLRRLAAVLAVLAGAVLACFLVLPSTSAPAAPPAPVPLAADQPTRTVTVDVQGKVRRPGLQHLPDGARVHDAITASGGAVPGTDTSTLNLARRLSDGEQLQVGAPPSAADPARQPLVNLNTAPVYQLDALPGVGIVTAQRIVEYRNRQRFTDVDQLRQIEGIGPTRFSRLKDLVTV